MFGPSSAGGAGNGHQNGGPLGARQTADNTGLRADTMTDFLDVDVSTKGKTQVVVVLMAGQLCCIEFFLWCNGYAMCSTL